MEQERARFGNGSDGKCDPMNIRIAHGAIVVAALTIVGCSSEDRSSIATDLQTAATDIANAAGEVTDDVAEALARTIATQQGEEQFKNAGEELDGPLTCEATVQDDAANIAISCTGTTKGGGAATLTGTTNEIPGASVVSLDGDFTGAVDGTEVFTTQRLGG
jgi:outer membrane murein-binding lipoprotein Lpp